MAFNRIIRVEAGPDGGKSIIVTKDDKGYCPYISFDIEKTTQTTANKCKLKIHNLGKDTAMTIAAKNNLLIVGFGYEDEDLIANIFFGSVKKSTYGRDGTDWVLSVEALDETEGEWNQKCVLSFKKNTSVKTVFDAIMRSINIPVAGKLPVIEGAYPQGYSFCGKTITALGQVLGKAGFKYSIQNRNLYIYEDMGKETVAPGLEGLILNYQTGLIRVERMDKCYKAGKSKKELKGASFKVFSLLFPQLMPESIIRIESDDFVGQLQIDSVKMKGDSWGGDAQAEIEGRAM